MSTDDKENSSRTCYYEITKNTDSVEGRGSTVGTNIFFWEHGDALAFVSSDRYRKFGVMGTTGSTYDIKRHSAKLPKIYTSLEEYDSEHSSDTLRKKALSKLTKEEKRLLGLS